MLSLNLKGILTPRSCALRINVDPFLEAPPGRGLWMILRAVEERLWKTLTLLSVWGLLSSQLACVGEGLDKRCPLAYL